MKALIAFAAILAMAGAALAAVSADPPGPNNRVTGSTVPNGTYTGTMHNASDNDEGQDGYRLVLTQPAVDEEGEVIDTLPPLGEPDYPPGTVLFFNPETDSAGDGADEDRNEQAASDATVQQDGDNQVDIHNGNVTGVRTFTRPPGQDSRGDG